MFLELIYTLLFLGAAQGLFLAVALATKHTNHTANRILAVAMLAFSTFILESLYYARGYYRAYPHFIGVSHPLIFVFGPVLYLYAQTVSRGGHTFRKAALLHFLPAALVALSLAPFYVQGGAAKIEFLQKLMREGPPRDVAIIEDLQIPYGIIYVILTIMLLRRHRMRLRDTHSYLERINLLWLRNLTIGIVTVWGLATGLFVLDITGRQMGKVGSMLVPLAVSVLVYAVGYLGLRQPEIFQQPPQRTPPRPFEPRQLSISASVPEGATDDSTGYERSGLTQAQAEAHLRELLRLMEEKQLYKNSLLTLQELADEMSISPHHLSQVINTQLGKNFYDFVNGYRVEEIKRRLRDPKSLHLTILAIALDAGFNTKSSFNAFFKKHTGLTPSQYRAQGREAA